LPACSQAERDTQIQATYDQQTGKLSQLTYDSNNNGTPDSWTYMDGTTLIRSEIDHDEDGLVDRWEYFDADRQLEKVGLSLANDGIVDSWVYQGPDGTLLKVEVSTARDGTANRTEYYEAGQMVRAEEDSDRNGAIDKWETFSGGVLTSVAFDTEGTGAPTRRLVYGPGGNLDRVESGDDIDRSLFQ
jgi:hypothetical protein